MNVRHMVKLTGTEKTPTRMSAFSDLDEMIRQGYGDVPQWQLPDDWRTVHRENQKEWAARHMIGIPEEMLPRRPRAAAPGKG